MNVIRTTMAAMCLFGSMAACAFAAGEMLSIKVPFAFEANGKEMPAGAYTISERDPSGVVYLRGSGGAVMLTSTPAGGDAPGKPGLVFERVNGKAYLMGVQMDGMSSRAVSLHAGPAPANPLR